MKRNILVFTSLLLCSLLSLGEINLPKDTRFIGKLGSIDYILTIKSSDQYALEAIYNGNLKGGVRNYKIDGNFLVDDESVKHEIRNNGQEILYKFPDIDKTILFTRVNSKSDIISNQIKKTDTDFKDSNLVKNNAKSSKSEASKKLDKSKNKYKEKKYKNGDFYTGELKKGKPNGQGIMTFVDGSIYDGLWTDGKIAGDGRIENKSGTFTGIFTPLYDNEILIGIKPIKGVSSASGVIMDGEWDEQNVFTGIMKKGNSIFEGVIENEIFTEGRLNFSNGGFMEGTMLLTPQFEGKIQNATLQNSYIVDRPAVYSGVFKNGKFIGNIKGGRYSTHINNFEIEVNEIGEQTASLTLNNGTYKGGIEDKKFNGEGILANKNGTFTGVWNNGVLMSGDIKQWDDSGNTFYFTVKNNKATYEFPDGEILTVTGTLDGNHELHSQVTKRKTEKIEKERQESLRIARAKAIKELDQKYVGMVFQGEGSILALTDDGGAAFLGLLLGSQMTQNLRVTFLPGGKVNVRETDTNAKSSDPRKMSDSQLLAMAMNSQGGSTFEATIEGDKIILSKDLYIVVSKDKKYLEIYGLSAAYRLKRL